MGSLIVAVVAVVLLNAYAALLIWLRSLVYGVRLYRPMLVNILLSAIPPVGGVAAVIGLILVGWVFAEDPTVPAPVGFVVLWTYLVLGTALWVLFFPNSIYLITELNFSHRREDDPVPLWYDIVQTLALTLSGIANAVLGMAIVQTGFIVVLADPSRGAPPAGSWVFAGIVIVLGAVGVYLGRYLRFNSWDVRHPASMLRKLGTHLRTRGKALEAGAFVLTHAVLLALVYVPLYSISYAVILSTAA